MSQIYEATICKDAFPFITLVTSKISTAAHLGHGRQVDRHAHQPVAEHAPHEGRGKGQGRLGRRQRHGGAAVWHGAGEDGQLRQTWQGRIQWDSLGF